MNKFALSLFCLLIGFSCKKDNGNSGNTDFFNPVYVDFTINLSLPDAAELKFPNGYFYSSFGYKGIVVYNTGFSGSDQYVAFDRACPYKTDSICSKVTMETNALFLTCGQFSGTKFVNCCGSKFSAQNGGVVSGSANRGLKQYYVYNYGNTLRVTSSPI